MQNGITRIAELGEKLFDIIPDMLVLYDRDTRILDIRHPIPELCTLPDGKPAEGRTLTHEALHGLSADYLDRLRVVCEQRQPARFVYRLSEPGQQDRFYEVILTCLENDRVLAVIRAIAEQSVARIESGHLHSFFSRVLEHIAIPVCVKSMTTERYVFWSKKAEVFGRTAEEMLGGKEDLFMTPDQARTVQHIDRELTEGNLEQYQGIEKYRLCDGKEHSFVITRTPFIFGEEELILCSALDISELKETRSSLESTQNDLAHKNMTLSSVLSLARIVPWHCDLASRIFYCDYNAYHHESATGPDEQGRYVIPMERYFDAIHPDYRQDAIRMIEELAEDRQAEFHETYLVHWYNDRDWEWVQVQSSIAERDADGKPMRLIGSACTITEQKKTELALQEAKQDLALKNEMLSSVLSIAQVIPWKCDVRTQTFSCDYATYHHESTSGPDAQGRYSIPTNQYIERIHPDYRSRAYEQYMEMLDGHTNILHEEYPIRWYNDHDYEWVEILSNVAESDPDGKPIQLVGSARVVTSQKRMEESLREAKENAERSNTLKSAFLANMSHEIRTPLNAIVGFSELLGQAEEEEEKREYLHIIRSSNELLLQLIADILDLSKIEAGTLDFSFADYDLGTLMEELEQTARMKVLNPAVEVSCTNRQPGCTIHTDRGRLLQVMHNFINNAAKFTDSGHIHFGYTRNPDGRWYFYVEDTGCGIPADKRERIFDRFVKLDGKIQGTGLGLAISKSIVERLGGEIGVCSAVGSGSTFWFLLPAGSVVVAESASVSVTPPAQASKASGTLTILIAEDDSANYKLFEAMLKKHYNLIHAWNGRQAVEMFREQHPHIILMDIRMPEMDGYEATAAIRSLSADIPIIAVTAFAYPEDMRRILAGGFNGCLPKPVNSDSLKKKITELCPGVE